MMPRSLLPADEAARLRTLHQHAAAPLLREPIFDELVRLTAHAFGLPISFISLVAAD